VLGGIICTLFRIHSAQRCIPNIIRILRKYRLTGVIAQNLHQKMTPHFFVTNIYLFIGIFVRIVQELSPVPPISNKW